MNGEPEMTQSRWQRQFEELPGWAKKMVRGLAGCAGYGVVSLSDTPIGVGVSKSDREKYSCSYVILDKTKTDDWWDGFFHMRDLAAALTAPWPPPAPAHREKRAFNISELVSESEDDGGGFDQPCAFGNRVPDHAVYCHNDAWPDSPRKCRRNRY